MTGKPDCSDAAAAPALLLWSRLIQALSRAPPSMPCSDINALSPQGPRVSPLDMRGHLPWFYPGFTLINQRLRPLLEQLFFRLVPTTRNL